MIALIEKIYGNTVDLFVEDTGFWFQLPKSFIRAGIKEGSRIQLGFEIVKEEEDDNFEIGGFIKNPPKKDFTE